MPQASRGSTFFLGASSGEDVDERQGSEGDRDERDAISPYVRHDAGEGRPDQPARASGGDQPAGAGRAAVRTGGDGRGDRPQNREAEAEERPAGDEHPEPGCEPLHDERERKQRSAGQEQPAGSDPTGEQADRHGGGERHDRRRREQRARLGSGETEPLLKRGKDWEQRRVGDGVRQRQRRDGEECAVRAETGVERPDHVSLQDRVSRPISKIRVRERCEKQH